MKKTRFLKCLMLISIVLVGLTACKKNKNEDNHQKNPEKLAYHFEGKLTQGATTSDVRGTFEIKNEQFQLTTMVGALYGSASQDGKDVVISNLSGAGVFAESVLTGKFFTNNNSLQISGNSFDGSTLNLEVHKAISLSESDSLWSAKHSKSAVIFSHFKSCEVSITVNGETLSGLQNHYNPGGVCPDERWFYGDVDNEVSTLFCAEMPLRLLNGETVMDTSCVSAAFVLDKNTHYSYTAVWENGDIEEGEFTSPDGAKAKMICLENKGGNCKTTDGGGDEETGQITVNTLIVDHDYSSQIGGDSILLNINPNVFILNEEQQTIQIGDRSGNYNTKIMVSPYGQNIANKTYDLNDWDEIRLFVLTAGNGVDLTNKKVYDTNGTIQIENFDKNTKSCKITFNDAIVKYSTSMGSIILKFSGTISGTFAIE